VGRPSKPRGKLGHSIAIGTINLRLRQSVRRPKVGAFEMSSSEDGTCEMRPHKEGVFEMSVDEVGAFEMRAKEFGAFKMCLESVGLFEMRLCKVGVPQVGPAQIQMPTMLLLTLASGFRPAPDHG
jgi:hypothetical protein